MSRRSSAELREESLALLDGLGSNYSDAQVEEFVATRLQAIQLLESGDRPSVVFVCVHNAGRSQMAAAWARRLGGDEIVVFSGGSAPGLEVNPAAVAAMAEVGIDISDEFPKPFTEEIIEAADVVVTMGCGDACPYFPGKRYVDWQLSDPHGQGIEMVREVRDDIEQRVGDLLVEMGVIERRPARELGAS